VNHRAVRPSALLHTLCLLLACGLWPQPSLGQEPPSPTNTTQKSQSPSEKVQSLFRIDVEDAIEAGLVEQQLKIRPVLIRDRSLYYCTAEAAALTNLAARARIGTRSRWSSIGAIIPKFNH